jgi:hypothetical protein
MLKDNIWSNRTIYSQNNAKTTATHWSVLSRFLIMQIDRHLVGYTVYDQYER